MRIGKLDNKALDRLIIKKLRHIRKEVKKGSAVGEDCAVIDFGEYDCVLSSDPITGAVKDIGRLAINVSCNDIASNGVEPLGILLTVMLPPTVEEADIERIMTDVTHEAEKINVEIIGGHTEITAAVNVPVISATAVGRGLSAHATDRKVEVGDYIAVTKLAGIEGTGIIAGDFSEELAGVLTDNEIAEAREMMEHTSVVKEGVIAGRLSVGPMHDVTEGGMLGALWEMCENSGVGVELDAASIPVADVTKKICEHFGLDPLRLISSGSMMMSVEPGKLDDLIAELAKEGISLTVIGRAVAAGSGTYIEPPQADELFKVLGR